MPDVVVEGMKFIVRDDLEVSKYDDWKFYQNKVKLIVGAKAVDLVILDKKQSVAYLIEVKDYRVDPITLKPRERSKSISLQDEVAAKVLHSLGGLVAARTRATDTLERNFAKAVCRMRTIRVVLHLEQSSKSRLFPAARDLANLRSGLKQRLKSVDPHAKVADKSNLEGLPWVVD